MTVLVTLDHESLEDVVTVDPRAAAVGESSAGLEPGDRLTVAELIEAALHTEYGGTGRPRPAWLHVAFQWRVLLPNANHRYQVPANRIERTAHS